jgi:DNA-binding NtrC family response regulator
MNDPLKPSGTSTIPLSSHIAEVLPPTQAPRRVVLLVYHRDGVEVVPLDPGASVVVGRAPPADVVIPDHCLSRSHARFSRMDADNVSVEDLGSTNGTKLGGEPIERASIKPGDQVMLGTIAAAIHVLAGGEVLPLGLEGHDAFVAAVDAEISRARFFGRPLAVLVARAADVEKGLLPRWCPSVRQLLRPVDRIGLYGAGVVEILAPEMRLEEALALAQSIVARREGEPPLACGVAMFPEAGSSTEALVLAAREASRRADRDEPVRAAPSGVLRTLSSGAEVTPMEDGELVAQSPGMRALAETAMRVARSSIPLLLQGETGAGKEVLARLIHRSGPRRREPLVCVNCGAIPSQLVESTLFGHEKGAFTGALQQQKGVFEAADGGTVLLDEIGELPAPAQAALLRVLETKRVTRVGSVREIEVDVRVIAATHRDLEAMSAAGGFRVDLYYRLGAMVIAIPPLRERREDIALLSGRFLAHATEAARRGPMSIDPEALALLERYAWPGNARELRNALERAVVIAEGDVVTPLDLPERVRAGGAAKAAAPKAESPADLGSLGVGSLKEQVERFERSAIIAVLRETDGHQTKAARLLDVPLRTLQHKIKSYGLKKHYGTDDDA